MKLEIELERLEEKWTVEGEVPIEKGKKEEEGLIGMGWVFVQVGFSGNL